MLGQLGRVRKARSASLSDEAMLGEAAVSSSCARIAGAILVLALGAALTLLKAPWILPASSDRYRGRTNAHAVGDILRRPIRTEGEAHA